MPIFGQILAAFYQFDIVEEDDIRKWHSLSNSTGEGRKPGVEAENFNKGWVIGSHMIKQFDAQGSDSEEDSGSEDEDEQGQEKGVDEKPTQENAEDEGTTETGSEMETETESEGEMEDTHPRRRNTIVATGPPAGVRLAARPLQESTAGESETQRASNTNHPASVEDSESDAELTDSTEARDAGVSASDDSGTSTNTDDEESEGD
jgi:translation initiation factor eIF-2B subunit epsilon